MASNEAVKFGSAVPEQELDVFELLAEAHSEVAGLLHSPLARGVRGNAAEVHPAGAMLDKHQDVQSLQQHGVHVQEVHCEDPGGLRMEKLPPRRARAARRRIDARGTQDLPHRGRRDHHAELGQFAVDPAVSPERILLRQANDKAGDTRDCPRAAGLAAIARVVLARGQHAVPGQQRRGRDGEDFGPTLAREQPCQRGEPHPVRWLVPDPAGVPGAGPRFRAAAPAAQHPLPCPCGIAAQPSRVSGEPAGRRS